MAIYRRLYACYGPQHWWPADQPFEVIVGAILTQSASWTNVEKAILNLKRAGILNPVGLRSTPHEQLGRVVYPSGYYNVKARKLKAFADYLGNRFGDELQDLFAGDLGVLRKELLNVYGIGEETADSILLYAGGKPVFVTDAYTKRLFSRIGLASEDNTYSAVQSIFMVNLSHDVQLFNEYHALIVEHGKEVCRKKPLCNCCCINGLCAYFSNFNIRTNNASD